MARDEAGKSRGEDVQAALAGLHSVLSSVTGPGNTEQVSEYIDHHEFGLALELIVSLVVHHGLEARAYEAEVERLAAEMEMDDSRRVSEWRKYLGEA